MLRIYNGMHATTRRKSKGRKRKHRRLFRAKYKDGWERKKAGGLAPSTFYEKKYGYTRICQNTISR